MVKNSLKLILNKLCWMCLEIIIVVELEAWVRPLLQQIIMVEGFRIYQQGMNKEPTLRNILRTICWLGCHYTLLGSSQQVRLIKTKKLRHQITCYLLVIERLLSLYLKKSDVTNLSSFSIFEDKEVPKSGLFILQIGRPEMISTSCTAYFRGTRVISHLGSS
uniref:Uncharacterized protein n=1 Tax=Oryza brachyantha TaxID=4533 RepID=J3N8G2_ORYBR